MMVRKLFGINLAGEQIFKGLIKEVIQFWMKFC